MLHRLNRRHGLKLSHLPPQTRQRVRFLPRNRPFAFTWTVVDGAGVEGGIVEDFEAVLHGGGGACAEGEAVGGVSRLGVA